MPSRIIQLSNQEHTKMVAALEEIHLDLGNEIGSCHDLTTVGNLQEIRSKLTEVITDLKTFYLP